MNHFFRLGRLFCAGTLAALLVACAHPISIEPAATPARDVATLVNKKVAYVMTDADRAKQVTTEGGGGDKVSYFPYRDLEKAIREALRAVYEDVMVMRSASDGNAVKEAGVAYVFAPEITTTSSSPSPFTWPPTRFTVEFGCTVTDADNNVLARLRAPGDGAAEFSEFKRDFGLAGRRAGEAASARLAEEIRGNAKLR
jgi:hypothetical protein